MALIIPTQGACNYNGGSVKIMPIMAAWAYNWTAARMAKGESVYFSSQDSFGRPLYSAPPRVLALSPKLPLDHITTLHGLQVWKSSTEKGHRV